MTAEELMELEKKLQDGWIQDKPYIFVSYASKNKEPVFETVLELRKRGINVYIDVELQENISKNWIENVKERLLDYDCKGMVSFLSIDFMRSYACLMEQLMTSSDEMLENKGHSLTNFYISLDQRMSTAQGINEVIYGKDAKDSQKMKVTMIPEERTFLEEAMRNNPVIRNTGKDISKELDKIKTKHNVVTNMYLYFFAEKSVSLQLYKSAQECVHLLYNNLVNEKNESIKIEVLPELIDRYKEVNPGKKKGILRGDDPEEDKKSGKDSTTESGIKERTTSDKGISSKINQICMVIQKVKEQEKNVYDYSKLLQKAYANVADELSIGKSSVVDKCQRQLGLRAEEFTRYVKEHFESESDTLYKIVFNAAKSQEEKELVNHTFDK